MTIFRTPRPSLRVTSLFLATLSALLIVVPTRAQGPSSSSLPDAPSFLQTAATQVPAPTSGTARIHGVVLDVSGALVPGATVKLEVKKNAIGRLSDIPKPGELEDLYNPSSEVLSDSAGVFEFHDLPTGIYRVLITARGLEPFLSERMELTNGQRFELPNIALPVATAGLAVTVYATSAAVAEAELKLETQQRVLGIAPNFYESFVWNAAPLTTKQKFKLAIRSRVDPFIVVPTAIRAGIETARDTYPGWGQDAPSYAKRFAAAYGDALFGRLLGEAVFPSIFHQDPRYFYMGPAQPTSSRIWHAISSGIIVRGDNGKLQPNYSHILGNASAGALSTVYHPAGTSPQTLAGRNALYGIAGSAVVGLVREFVLDHFTHKVPGYAKGKPADDPK